jgi:predicted glycosyltransferase
MELPQAFPPKPRVMLYSHDTYGLGHLRRSLTIAAQLSHDIPAASQLLITGSIVPGAFGLPDGVDMVKLPALTKHSDGRYAARILPLPLPEIIGWRLQMIAQAAITFRPDLLLVDKSAAGVQRELIPTLRYLKSHSPQTRLVLGMRDIEDSPEATRAEWDADGVTELLEDIYDWILLYGERDVFDPVVEYDLPHKIQQKLIPVGYLGRAQPSRSRLDVRRELGADDRPLILVTVGGGGDGARLIETYLEALRSGVLDPAGLKSVIVTGPLMAKGKRTDLRSAADIENVTLLEFTHELSSYMAAADLVVSMAGYNTVREALSLRARVLLVPRTRPRVEQLIRARRLASRGLVRYLVPDDLSPQRLALEVQTSLSLPPPTVDLDFNGVEAASGIISNLLAGGMPAGWEFPAGRIVDTRQRRCTRASPRPSC